MQCSAGVKVAGVGAEMAERDQRQRRVERVHLAGDQLALHIGQHPAADEIERAVGIDRPPRGQRQRDEGGVAAAEIGAIKLRQIIDVRARIGERAACGQPLLKADDAVHGVEPLRGLDDLPSRSDCGS